MVSERMSMQEFQVLQARQRETLSMEIRMEMMRQIWA